MPIDDGLLTRREAIRRVSVMLGGVAFVGGSGLLTACERARVPAEGVTGTFTSDDVAFLGEIADTILPDTKTPGAKAAKTGAFMARMVTDSYSDAEQHAFREGMRRVDETSRNMNNAAFMAATPSQRLAVLAALDRQQKAVMDAREAASRRKTGLAPVPAATGAPTTDAYLPDARKENTPATHVSDAPAISADEPPHFFRMMKELTLLGYFTSEIGCTKALRYVETPGRFDPCTAYTPGEPASAAHA